MPEGPGMRKLLDLVARLRAPGGCPWDREQELPDCRAYLLEEAHEAAAAIDSGDREELAGELGDLLFQAAFILRLAEEEGAFTLDQVIERVHGKMVARHPHVFAGESLAGSAEVRQAWERRKLREEPRRGSLLAGVPGSLPALLAAYRLSQKAAGVGFDWPDANAVLDKVGEEIEELRRALAGEGPERVRAELGDLLFSVANLARKLGADPEAALAGSNEKFRRRFAHVEGGLAARGRTPADASLAEMEDLWQEAKQEV